MWELSSLSWVDEWWIIGKLSKGWTEPVFRTRAVRIHERPDAAILVDIGLLPGEHVFANLVGFPFQLKMVLHEIAGDEVAQTTHDLKQQLG